MVVLWSDIVVWLIAFGLLAFLYWLKHRPDLKARWQLVVQSRVALVSSMILITFLLVALADSIHWRTDNPYRPVVSLLDVGLGNISTGQEKSYSAPFAMVGLWQETSTLADGRIQRAPVRLQEAAKEVADESGKRWDIAMKSTQWLMVGALIAGLLLWWLHRLGLQTVDVCWRTFTITLLTISLVLTWLWGMGQSYHVLGTGKVGQDVLYETIKGVRTGVLIGGLTTIITLPFAVLLGIAAGYFRGWVDDGVQYAYTTLNAIPGVLLIASAMLLVQLYLAEHAANFSSEQERADVRLLLVCVVLGLTGWTGLARILRAESFKLREMEFVKAARAFGVSHGKIIWRHLLPNVGHLVLIAVVLDFSGLVLAEAVLSYVGIGVDPTMASWGNMINLARQELNREPVVWWNLIGAFMGMFTLVLSANLLADRIQQVFNPRAKE